MKTIFASLSLLIIYSNFGWCQNTQNFQLFQAIKSENYIKVDSLIKSGANVNALDSTKATTLMWAAYDSDLEMVKLLIKNGANYKAKGILPVHRVTKDFNYGSLLTTAAGEGKYSIVSYLVDSLNVPVDEREINIDGSEGMTALMRACEWGKQKVVEYFISKKADLNLVEYNSKKNALFIAIENGNINETEILSKEKSINYSLNDSFNKNIFHYLAESKFRYFINDTIISNIIKNLPKKLSDIKDINGNIPILEAYNNNNFILFDSLFKFSNYKYKNELNSKKTTLLKSNPNAWQFLFKKASAYYSSHNYKQVIEILPDSVISLYIDEFGKSRLYHLKGMTYSELDESKKANDSFLNALNLLQTNSKQKSIDFIETLHEQGNNYYRTGDLDNFEKNELQCLSIAYDLFGENSFIGLQIENSLSIYYGTIGNNILAKKYGENCIRQYINFAQFDFNYADQLINNSFIYFDLGELESAKEVLDEALLVLNKNKNQNLRIICLKQMAIYYAEIGQYDKLNGLLNEVVEIHKELGDTTSRKFAYTLNDIARNESITGNFFGVISNLQKAINILEKLNPNHINLGNFYYNLGKYYYETGNFEKSKEVTLKAVHIRLINQKNKITPDLISYNNLLCRNFYALKEYLKADSVITITLNSISPEIKEDNIEFAFFADNIYNIFIKDKKYEYADSLITAIQKKIEKKIGKNNIYYLNNLISKAKLYNLTSDFITSYDILKEALSISNKLTINRISKIKLLEEMAIVSNNLKNKERNTILSQLYKLYSDHFRINSFALSEAEYILYSKKLESTQNLILDLANINNNSELTFEESIISKSFYFYNSDNFQKKIIRSGDRNMIESMKNIKNLLRSQIGSNKQNDLSVFNEKNKLANFFLNRNGFILDSINLNEFSKSISSNIVLIDLYTYKSQKNALNYVVNIFRSDWKKPKSILLFEEKQLIKYLEISLKDDHRNTVNQIYNSKNGFLEKYIYQKLAPYLNNIKTIYYSPSGLMNRLAFAAIPINKTQKLIDKFEIKQITSTREIQIRDTLKFSPFKNIVLYGGIKYESDSLHLYKYIKPDSNSKQTINLASRGNSRGGLWDSLANSRVEINQIKKIFANTSINISSKTDYEANEESIKRLGESGNSPDILHFATHGFAYAPKIENNNLNNFEGETNRFKASDNSLSRTGLLFAGANRAWSGKAPLPNIEDGILTALEVSNLDLSNTKLVVMSACETALGDIKGNEGVFGLQRAFKMAGVKYTISSLWRIPDKETAEFMTDFYSNLAKTNDIESSFIKTQRYMKAKYSPYFWAGFVLVK